jgi:hypothetical protein
LGVFHSKMSADFLTRSAFWRRQEVNEGMRFAHMRTLKLFTTVKDSNRLRMWIGASFVFLLTFAMFAVYVRQPSFIDEVDNMLGGASIADGRIPYLDFYSQHTPLAYYLSAIGHWLGATSLIWQRVFFYGVVAVALSALYVRNAKSFGFMPMLLVGAVYVASHAANPNLSYTFLSDQIQAVAYLFLFLEFLDVAIFRSRRRSTWIVISVAAFVAVGVTFVAAYFVFTVVLGTFILQAVDFYRARDIRPSRRRDIVNFVAWPVTVVFAPFVISLIILLAQGALQSFWDQAYVLNRDVYSRYMGGFGSDPIASAFQPFLAFMTHVTGTLNSFSVSVLSASRDLLNFSALLVLCVGVAIRRPTAGVIVLLLAGFSVMRGWHGFHSQPSWGLAGLAIVLLLWSPASSPLNFWPKSRGRVFQFAIAVPLTVLLFVPFVKVMVEPVPPNGLTFGSVAPSTKVKIIQALVPAGQTYFDTSLDIGPFIESHRLPSAGVGGLVPWFSDVYEDEIIRRLEIEKPTLIFHDPKTEVWGYAVEDYAPKLNAYILSNYASVEMSEGDFASSLFIRKADLEKVNQVLIREFPFFEYRVVKRVSSDRIAPLGELLSNQEVKQTFQPDFDGLSAIQISTATYARENNCSLTMTLLVNSMETVSSQVFSCDSVPDNGMISLHFSPILDSAGKKFEVRIVSRNATPSNAVATWVTVADTYPEGVLTLDGIEQEGDLVMNLLKNR